MTISFSIELLNTPAVVTELGDMSDGLVEVQYRLCGFDGTRYAYRTGTATFSAPEPGSFLPYNTLTPNVVKQWTEDAASDEITALQTEIEFELAQPVQELKPLPCLMPNLANIGITPAP
jgi:hypothetical protein